MFLLFLKKKKKINNNNAFHKLLPSTSSQLRKTKRNFFCFFSSFPFLLLFSKQTLKYLKQRLNDWRNKKDSQFSVWTWTNSTVLKNYFCKIFWKKKKHTSWRKSTKKKKILNVPNLLLSRIYKWFQTTAVYWTSQGFCSVNHYHIEGNKEWKSNKVPKAINIYYLIKIGIVTRYD